MQSNSMTMVVIKAGAVQSRLHQTDACRSVVFISTIYSGHLSDYISLKGWWVQGNKKVTERLSSLTLFFLRSTEIILSLIIVIYSSTYYCGSCVWLHKKPISHLFLFFFLHGC